MVVEEPRSTPHANRQSPSPVVGVKHQQQPPPASAGGSYPSAAVMAYGMDGMDGGGGTDMYSAGGPPAGGYGGGASAGGGGAGPATGPLRSLLPPGMGGSAVRLVHSSSGHGAPFAA